MYNVCVDESARNKRLEDALRYGAESLQSEFKRACSKAEVFHSLVQAALAFSNSKDGGWIYVGVAERRDRTLVAEGLSEEQIGSYRLATLDESLASHGDPPILCSSFVLRLAGNDGEARNYIGIEVLPARDTIVLCKSPVREGKPVAGGIYIRNGHPPESRIARADEVRELFDRIVDRRLHSHVERLVRQGLLISAFPTLESNIQPYDEELNKYL